MDLRKEEGADEGERQGSSRGTLRGCRGERGEPVIEQCEVSRRKSGIVVVARRD